MVCNWCGTDSFVYNEGGKRYCKDCEDKMFKECITCHKPYPTHHSFELNDERCNSCEKRYINSKIKREEKINLLKEKEALKEKEEEENEEEEEENEEEKEQQQQQQQQQQSLNNLIKNSKVKPIKQPIKRSSLNTLDNFLKQVQTPKKKKRKTINDKRSEGLENLVKSIVTYQSLSKEKFPHCAVIF